MKRIVFIGEWRIKAGGVKRQTTFMNKKALIVNEFVAGSLPPAIEWMKK